MPIDKLYVVTSIYQDEEKVSYAICGETVDIILKLKDEDEFEEIEKGYILCCPEFPIPYV